MPLADGTRIAADDLGVDVCSISVDDLKARNESYYRGLVEKRVILTQHEIGEVPLTETLPLLHPAYAARAGSLLSCTSRRTQASTR